MIKIRRKRRRCPMCREKLELLGRRSHTLVCRRCLLVWHGDTFEPIARDVVGAAAIYDLFW